MPQDPSNSNVVPPRRIDKGIKRGPRQPSIKRHLIENQERDLARNEKGRFVSIYSAEKRAQVVDAALLGLEQGLTVKDIANEHCVNEWALYKWLVADSRAGQARTLFYSEKIMEALQEMRESQDPFQLARAREIRRAWHETAAVRDHNSFGLKQEVTVKQEVNIESVLEGFAKQYLAKIRGNTNKIIDVTPEEGEVAPSLGNDPPP